MTNHSRINIGKLSWLVILLAVGILASGALTRAFADSSEVIRIDDSSGQVSTETVEIILSGPPSEDSGEEDSIPIQVVEFDFADLNDDLAEQDQVEIVVVELEPVEVPQGDAPQLDPSQGPAQTTAPRTEMTPQPSRSSPPCRCHRRLLIWI